MSSDRKWAFFVLAVGILCLAFWGLPWFGIAFIAFAVWQLNVTKPASGEGNKTKNTNSKNSETSSSAYTHAVNTNRREKTGHHNITGQSCYDCKYCDNARTDQARRNEQIYCEYDSEHYYPEAGKDCSDFKKFI